MTRFDVFRFGPAQENQTPLGQVDVMDDGKLGLVRTEPGAGAALNHALADLNGREALVLKLPPGPEDDHSAILKDLVARDDPRFLDAIKDNLMRWHGMTLSPSA